jgi:hypothetical protein
MATHMHYLTAEAQGDAVLIGKLLLGPATAHLIVADETTPPLAVLYTYRCIRAAHVWNNSFPYVTTLLLPSATKESLNNPAQDAIAKLLPNISITDDPAACKQHVVDLLGKALKEKPPMSWVNIFVTIKNRDQDYTTLNQFNRWAHDCNVSRAGMAGSNTSGFLCTWFACK